MSSYPRRMTELDQVWSQMLDEAAVSARGSGRHHVADYLRLKATNDAIRERGVGWLFDTLIEISSAEMRNRPNITIERESPHSFAVGASRMAGYLLRVRQGVRCLTLEAGWARSPSDGIMRNGALAFARITHFGIPKAGAEFRLVHVDTLPQWLGYDNVVIGTAELRRHMNILLGV